MMFDLFLSLKNFDFIEEVCFSVEIEFNSARLCSMVKDKCDIYEILRSNFPMSLTIKCNLGVDVHKTNLYIV